MERDLCVATTLELRCSLHINSTWTDELLNASSSSFQQLQSQLIFAASILLCASISYVSRSVVQSHDVEVFRYFTHVGQEAIDVYTLFLPLS